MNDANKSWGPIAVAGVGPPFLATVVALSVEHTLGWCILFFICVSCVLLVTPQFCPSFLSVWPLTAVHNSSKARRILIIAFSVLIILSATVIIIQTWTARKRVADEEARARQAAIETSKILKSMQDQASLQIAPSLDIDEVRWPLAESESDGIRLLQDSDNAVDRYLAAVATFDFEHADEIYPALEGELRDDRRRLWLLRGHRYFQAQDYEAASQIYRKIYKELPDNAGAAVFLAISLLRMEAGGQGNVGEALDILQRAMAAGDVSSYERARVRNAIGIALQKSVAGNRVRNIRDAIRHFEVAAQFFGQETYPFEWAATQNNIGVAQLRLPTTRKLESLTRAIHHLELALTVRTRTSHPEHWAESMNNIGVAWRDNASGDKKANLEHAIACLRMSLDARSELHLDQSVASTHNNLGSTLIKAMAFTGGKDTEAAMAHFNAALSYFKRESHPQSWAHSTGFCWQL